MADTVRSEKVVELAKLIDDHNGKNTVVLDIHEQSSWTDYFIISTVNSQAQMRGIIRYLRAFFKDNSIEPNNRHKQLNDDGWVLIDCGDFVIHLMNEEIRAFYDLERLWFSGKSLYHSSKSS
ncbi:MAG: ribosome silencing factor [Spirochaetales bacterium]|nr:ribosome silencing factor [Spirochaetales bacterium]